MDNLYAFIKYRIPSFLGFTEKLGTDLKPFTTLSYANGPSFADHYDSNEPNGRRNLTPVNTSKENYF